MLGKIIKISKRISVGPQPTEDSLEALHKKGFKSVINLSKKGELGQEFKPDEEKEAVEELGMKYAHLPVSLSNVKEAQIEEFCELVDELPTPIFIHCRIGQRCAPFALISYALKRELSAEQALQKASKLGMDWEAPMITRMITSYLEKQEKLAMAGT